jgi:hypothetical protein
MSIGGNNKFRDFLAKYDLDNETIDYKYQTKAAEYYRKSIKLSDQSKNSEESDEQPGFKEPQLEYAVGREKIDYSGEQEEVKEEVLDEEVKEAGAVQPEHKERAVALLDSLFKSTVKVGEKGVEIILYGSSYIQK